MKFVADWKNSWRWFSVQILAVIAVLPLVWVALPTDVKAFLPSSWEPWLLCILAVGGIVGRLVDQKK